MKNMKKLRTISLKKSKGELRNWPKLLEGILAFQSKCN